MREDYNLVNKLLICVLHSHTISLALVSWLAIGRVAYSRVKYENCEGGRLIGSSLTDARLWAMVFHEK